MIFTERGMIEDLGQPIKLQLSIELIAAIEFARKMETPIPSRAEMIRRLIAIGAAQNLKNKAAASEL